MDRPSKRQLQKTAQTAGLEVDLIQIITEIFLKLNWTSLGPTNSRYNLEDI